MQNPQGAYGGAVLPWMLKQVQHDEVLESNLAPHHPTGSVKALPCRSNWVAMANLWTSVGPS